MKDFSKYFDHTILRADATRDDVKSVLEEAVKYGFYGVCTSTCHLALSCSYLKDTDVVPVTVTGFPLGTSSTEAKLAETSWALENGAGEIDTVINVGALKDKNYTYFQKELKLLADLCHQKNALFKSILEICLLTDDEIVTASKAAQDAGVDFIKTSTGFSTGGATAEAVRLIKDTVGDNIRIKAAGGIRTAEDALKMIEAGADRLGCSASVDIVNSLSIQNSRPF